MSAFGDKKIVLWLQPDSVHWDSIFIWDILSPLYYEAACQALRLPSIVISADSSTSWLKPIKLTHHLPTSFKVFTPGKKTEFSVRKKGWRCPASLRHGWSYLTAWLKLTLYLSPPHILISACIFQYEECSLALCFHRAYCCMSHPSALLLWPWHSSL